MFDEKRADRAVAFFEQYLRHTKGKYAGQPFQLQPWQADRIIRPLYGTVNDDGTRQYRTAYVTMGRKNGKSEIAAGVALHGLTADREPGAEVYGAASDRPQAGIVYRVAAAMVRRSKPLNQRCRITESTKVISVPSTDSIYRVLSADGPRQHGLNASCVIFDEIHTQRKRALYEALTTGSGTRAQPLLFEITTAGIPGESPVWEDEHQYAVNIRDGIFTDPTFLSVIYELPADADWTDESLWGIPNPALDTFLDREEMRVHFRKALAITSEQASFRRLRLNQILQHEDIWLSMEQWRGCGGPVDWDAMRGKKCFGGLDLSTTKDVTALELAFPGDKWAIFSRFWIPGDDIHQRSVHDRVTYDIWVRDGWIHATEGNTIDYSFVRSDINEITKRFHVAEIGYDPYNATQLVGELQGDGIKMVPIRQGFASMSAASKEFERRVADGSMRHGDNPVLRWMASCTSVKRDNKDNIMPIKPDRGKASKRIDGIVAAIMAFDRTMRNVASVYERRGVRTI